MCYFFVYRCGYYKYGIDVAIINMLQTVVDWSLPQEILLSLLMGQAPPGSWFGNKTEETTLTGFAMDALSAGAVVQVHVPHAVRVDAEMTLCVSTWHM